VTARTAVFVGPTLPAERVAKLVPGALVLPPAAKGDVLRLLARTQGLVAIGLIDGYFETVPAVQHKEILLALESGVHVFGGASLGALRAAELEPFGMRGVGRVFEWFQTGELTDDDEVAVSHAPVEMGFRELSEAMVSVRDRVLRAREEGILDDALARAVLHAGKRLFYPERRWPRILDDVRRAHPDSGEALARFERFIASSGPSIKQRDAEALLERLAAFVATAPGPLEVPFRVERTVYFESARLEAERLETGSRLARESDGSEVSTHAPPNRPVPEGLRALRDRALLRVLARSRATELGIEIDADEVQRAADRFRAERGLKSSARTVAWMRAAGLDEETFTDLMEDALLLEALWGRHRWAAEKALVEELRLDSARDHGAPHVGPTDDM
jgi:hypothetical protein